MTPGSAGSNTLQVNAEMPFPEAPVFEKGTTSELTKTILTGYPPWRNSTGALAS